MVKVGLTASLGQCDQSQQPPEMLHITVTYHILTGKATDTSCFPGLVWFEWHELTLTGHLIPFLVLLASFKLYDVL